jgi:hypothetical protein
VSARDLRYAVRNMSCPIRDFMRFRLVWSGSLRSSGNDSKPKDVRTIRDELHPQFEMLWKTHTALKRLQYTAITRPNLSSNIRSRLAVRCLRKKECDGAGKGEFVGFDLDGAVIRARDGLRGLAVRAIEELVSCSNAGIREFIAARPMSESRDRHLCVFVGQTLHISPSTVSPRTAVGIAGLPRFPACRANAAFACHCLLCRFSASNSVDYWFASYTAMPPIRISANH